ALAVGDAVFQHRCLRRIREMQAQGKTLLFVSHDIGLVKALCTDVLFLHAGTLQAAGDPAEVAMLYHAHVARLEGQPAPTPAGPGGAAGPRSPLFRPDPAFDRRAGLFRHGTGTARVRNVEIVDDAGAPREAVGFDEPVTLRVHVEFHEAAPSWILGFYVRDREGIDLLGTNTH